jgi:type IV secretory pathway ATPase VirB11/archaellum biosynthesis ATPase
MDRRVHSHSGADLTVEQLIANGALTMEMLQLLAGCVKARLNILISGGTGLVNDAAQRIELFIPADERVGHIEDAAELRLQQEHVVRLETCPPNAEGRGEVVVCDLGKRVTYASRPISSVRFAARSAGHASGNEHRSRGFARDGSRELAARRIGAIGNDDSHDGTNR